MKRNYQVEMEAQIASLAGSRPPLLLHSCCGPCSSAVLERLIPHFTVTLYFHNPNIYPQSEYEKRLAAQKALLEKMPLPLISTLYEPEQFYGWISGLEASPEGGPRCASCIAGRMTETARYASRHGFPYFTTTLSVSAHKDAALINQVGAQLGAQYGVSYLYADFKKRGGFQRSVALSKAYGLYRQTYCGCEYSMRKDFM